MLLQFIVENFLSFRGSVTLSMLAADGVPHDERHILRGPEGRKVLRCAAIYGANASGKSNLLKALGFARNLILEGTRGDRRIGVRPFKLDPALKDAPCRVELEIGAGERRYSYGFEVTATRVHAEWLLLGEGGEERVLFERQAVEGEPSASPITIGGALAEDAERRQFLRFVAQGTRPNQLFLTEAHERNVTELSPLIHALQEINIIWPDARFGGLIDELEEDAEFGEFLGTFMRNAGTGLERLEVERSDLDAAKLPKELTEELQEGDNYLSDGSRVRRSAGEDKLEFVDVVGIHRARGGAPVKFTLTEESDGTQRLLHLAPALYYLNKPGWISYVIDELERSLHPLLTRLFLKIFLDSGAPDAPAQLLFTTHDTNLLDLSLLSRDSIWFTEKDPEGNSALYSLAEFKGEQLERLSEHLEQGYLQGRFGAIPFFGDPLKLRWHDLGDGSPCP